MKSGIQNLFTTTWNTALAGSSASNQITIPTATGLGNSYNCVVAWGDGTSSTITTNNDAAWTHTYPSSGIYTVVISVVFTGIRFANTGDCLKILNVSRWGNFRFNQQASAFYGCANLTVTATDILDTTNMNRMDGYFLNCTSLTSIPSFNLWNHKNITLYSSCFEGCSNFNQTINITVTVATGMASMFLNCVKLNSPITINSTLCNSYSSFLQGATIFNSPISITTNSATTLALMFSGATLANPDVSTWVIAALTTASNMFASSAFNITNYDKLLNASTGWPSQGTIQNSVTFSAGSAHYSAGSPTTGRAVLTGTKSWTITDGGTP